MHAVAASGHEVEGAEPEIVDEALNIVEEDRIDVYEAPAEIHHHEVHYVEEPAEVEELENEV